MFFNKSTNEICFYGYIIDINDFLQHYVNFYSSYDFLYINF